MNEYLLHYYRYYSLVYSFVALVMSIRVSETSVIENFNQFHLGMMEIPKNYPVHFANIILSSRGLNAPKKDP